MKDLITAIGSVTILMVFILQFAFNQSFINRILIADKVADRYEREVNAGSEMSETEKYHVIEDIAEIFECDKSEVIVKEQDRKYTIEAPVKNIVAAGRFLGISDEENRAIYKVEGELP